jgi:hypothetical protein
MNLGGRRAAFTPLQLPMLQELFTLKRRKRRAPVQWFDARIVSGNSLPEGIAGELDRAFVTLHREHRMVGNKR